MGSKSLPDGVDFQIASTAGMKGALHLCVRVAVGSGGIEPGSVPKVRQANERRALAKSLSKIRSWRMTWSSLDELAVLGVWRLLLVGGKYLTCPPLMVLSLWMTWKYTYG